MRRGRRVFGRAGLARGAAGARLAFDGRGTLSLGHVRGGESQGGGVWLRRTIFGQSRGSPPGSPPLRMTIFFDSRGSTSRKFDVFRWTPGGSGNNLGSFPPLDLDPGPPRDNLDKIYPNPGGSLPGVELIFWGISRGAPSAFPGGRLPASSGGRRATPGSASRRHNIHKRRTSVALCLSQAMRGRS
jgi:hypothetical protein